MALLSLSPLFILSWCDPQVFLQSLSVCCLYLFSAWPWGFPRSHGHLLSVSLHLPERGRVRVVVHHAACPHCPSTPCILQPLPLHSSPQAPLHPSSETMGRAPRIGSHQQDWLRNQHGWRRREQNRAPGNGIRAQDTKRAGVNGKGRGKEGASGRMRKITVFSERLVKCFSRSSTPAWPAPSFWADHPALPSIMYREEDSSTEEVRICISFPKTMEKLSVGRNGKCELTLCPKEPSPSAAETLTLSLWGPQKSRVHTPDTGRGLAETLAGPICLPTLGTGPHSLETAWRRSVAVFEPRPELRSPSSAAFHATTQEAAECRQAGQQRFPKSWQVPPPSSFQTREEALTQGTAVGLGLETPHQFPNLKSRSKPSTRPEYHAGGRSSFLNIFN